MGRPKGSRNKRTSLQEQLDRFNCKPFEEMVEIAMAEADLDKRFRYMAEMVPYLHPKLKALEVDVNMELARQAEAFEELPAEEQLALMESKIKELREVVEEEEA